MQLHDLHPTIKRKKIKRIGRGGKRGTYSGRGIKGQKSRSGRKIRPAERDLIMRLPKLHAFRNKSLKSKEATVINLEDLEEKIKNNIINRQTLLEAGLIRKSDTKIKILAKGEAKREFQIEGIKLSKSAKKKIEAAGGAIK